MYTVDALKCLIIDMYLNECSCMEICKRIRELVHIPLKSALSLYHQTLDEVGEPED